MYLERRIALGLRHRIFLGVRRVSMDSAEKKSASNCAKHGQYMMTCLSFCRYLQKTMQSIQTPTQCSTNVLIKGYWRIIEGRSLTNIRTPKLWNICREVWLGLNAPRVTSWLETLKAWHVDSGRWLQNRTFKSGWWFEPLWKILVNWDDYSQYMGK